MLEVVVNLVPGGDRRFMRRLAIAEVGNISDLTDISDYAVAVAEGRNPIAGRDKWAARGHILKHDRRQSVWALVRRVAEFAEGEAEKQR